MWYARTVEIYSALKKNEAMTLMRKCVGRGGGLEVSMLSEITQAEKDKYPMCSPTCMS